jgi:tetratricopeptide (TPR) repeat protein
MPAGVGLCKANSPNASFYRSGPNNNCANGSNYASVGYCRVGPDSRESNGNSGSSSLQISPDDYKTIIRGAPAVDGYYESQSAMEIWRQGLELSRENYYREAIEKYNKALAVDPSFLGAYTSRGYAWKALGKLKKACKDWRYAASYGVSDSSYALSFEGCK